MKHLRNNPSSASRDRVEKYVKELSALEETCFLGRGKNWQIPYLERVYKLDKNWRRKKVSKERRADLGQFRFGKRPIRKDKKTLHLIIECTSKANSRTRNRWASALLAARANKIEPKRILDFLLEKGKGGIAGRADEYAKLRKMKKGPSRKAGKVSKSEVSHKTSPQGTGGSTNRIAESLVSQTNDNDNDDWD